MTARANNAVESRRPARRIRAARAVAAMILFAGVAPIVNGQNQGNNSNNNSSNQNRSNPVPQILNEPNFGNYDTVFVERRLHALNVERQKQLVADTNKLVKLAQELHDEVAVANTGAWTPEQLHKIGEMEKLARSVKERMTTAVGETSPMVPGLPPVYPTH